MKATKGRIVMCQTPIDWTGKSEVFPAIVCTDEDADGCVDLCIFSIEWTLDKQRIQPRGENLDTAPCWFWPEVVR